LRYIVEECLLAALHQLCLAQKMRNIAVKLPEDIRAEFEAAAKASCYAPSAATTRALHDDLVECFERWAPAAVGCFQENLEADIVQLQVPIRQRCVEPTINLLERLSGETRRRSYVANAVCGERSVF
jgi:transposase-like protein